MYTDGVLYFDCFVDVSSVYTRVYCLEIVEIE